MKPEVFSIKKETRISLVLLSKHCNHGLLIIFTFRGNIIEGIGMEKFLNIYEVANSIISYKYYGETRYLIIIDEYGFQEADFKELYLRIVKPIILTNKLFSIITVLGLSLDEARSILNYYIKHIDTQSINFLLKLSSEVKKILIEVENSEARS